MLHLKNVMSSEYPVSKMVTPTIVDLNFNVEEIVVDGINDEKVTMYQYETYRFENLDEYIQYQNEENAKQFTEDNITIMLAQADSFEQQSMIQADQFTIMDAIADLYEQIALLKGGE